MADANRLLVWSPEAEQDLLEIWAYLAGEASPHVADVCLGDIDNACRHLEEWPLSGRPRNELMYGLRSILARSYVVLYRVADHGVEIIRVIHGKRDIDAIFREVD